MNLDSPRAIDCRLSEVVLVRRAAAPPPASVPVENRAQPYATSPRWTSPCSWTASQPAVAVRSTAASHTGQLRTVVSQLLVKLKNPLSE